MWQKLVNWIKSMQFAKIMCAFLTVTAVTLFIWGFFVPPLGVIDGSVLKAGGIILSFAALWVFAHVVIEMEITARLKLGSAEVVVENEDKEENKDKK